MKKNGMRNIIKSNTFILFCVTIVVILVFFIANHNFLTLTNVQGVLLSMGFDGILVLGTAIVLICGEVDLSCGAIACLCGTEFGFIVNAGIPWGFALLFCLLTGMLLGLINAFFINELKFMNFMLTLAMAQVYRGFAALALKNKNIQVRNQSMQVLGINIGILPVSFVIMVVLLIIYSLVLNRRQLGRAVYLVGGNREAARLAGINPKRISYFAFVNNGMLGALAGVIYTARMHTASSATGTNAETSAITAAVLGGISFLGGSGSVAGCFVGVMLLDFFNTGLTAVGFPAYWQIVARGALLIAALVLDFFTYKVKQVKISNAV